MKTGNRIGSGAGTWVSPSVTSSNLECVPMITALRHPLVLYSCYSNIFLAHISLSSLWNCHISHNKVRRHGTYCFHLACEFCYPILEGISFLWHNVFMTDPCLLSSKYLHTLVYFIYCRSFSGDWSSTGFKFLPFPRFYVGNPFTLPQSSVFHEFKQQLTALRLLQEAL